MKHITYSPDYLKKMIQTQINNVLGYFHILSSDPIRANESYELTDCIKNNGGNKNGIQPAKRKRTGNHASRYNS